MTILIALILGLVQGLAEFLPVSSSGHLLLLEKLFGITDGGYFFTVVLHLGTLAAVLVVYRKRVFEMLAHPIKQLRYWLYLIAATLVTTAMALAFDDFIDSAGDGRVLGWCFLLTALLLTVQGLLVRHLDCNRTVPEMKWYHPLFIGFMQGIAILPGVSRSGATITGAAAGRLNREDAAECSFMLSIPAILGGAVLEIPKALKEGMAGVTVPCLIVGVAAAAAAGYFAVRFMIRLITKRSLTGFAVYTAILGVLVLLDQYLLHYVNWGF